MAGPAIAGDLDFREEYEYSWPDAAWYPDVGRAEPRLDYVPATDIPSQQGEDFGIGYDPDQVGFGQGPREARTRLLHTRYEFFYGAADCRSLACGSLPFADGFES